MPILSSLGSGSARSYGLVRTLTSGGITFTYTTSTINLASTFNSTGTWTAPSGTTSVQYLLVAGGGAGGGPSSAAQGGGGAGGLLTSPSFPVSPGATYTFTIGGGGTCNSGAPSSHGSNSTLTSPAPGFTTLTAFGGGRGGEGGDESGIDSAAGGMPYGPTPAPSPSQFGSGGGAGRGGYPLSFGTPGQGNYGGDGTNGGYNGGGGGGAGTGGGTSPGSPKAMGEGGDGLLFNGVYYAGGGGGGGGGGANTGKAGGLGGGGTPSVAGTTNRGGGGGAVANGGSGVGMVVYGVPVVVISSDPPVAGYIGWYNASSWTGSQWTDLSGSGNHAPLTSGSAGIVSATGNGATASFSALQGDTSTVIIWPTAILPSTWTLFHVTRYTGGTRRRIFTGNSNNWLSGFWNGNAGVAYHDGWLTSQVDTHGNSWLYSCDQLNLYRSNGVTRGSSGGTQSTRLTIGGAGGGGETSDWQCAEVLVYPSALSATDYQAVEAWLAGRYKIA